jgi:hypothetical protein
VRVCSYRGLITAHLSVVGDGRSSLRLKTGMKASRGADIVLYCANRHVCKICMCFVPCVALRLSNAYVVYAYVIYGVIYTYAQTYENVCAVD